MNRYKIHWQIAADGANQAFQNILQRRKKCQFSISRTCKLAAAGQNTWRLQARPENHCESKQTYFSCGFDKAFHLPEFQAIFFSREIEHE